LPDAFLRRCFLHYIRFSRSDTMTADHRGHFPGTSNDGQRSAETVLRNPRCAGHEEEAVDVGAARLAQAADGRESSRKHCAMRDPKKLIRRCTAR